MNNIEFKKDFIYKSFHLTENNKLFSEHYLSNFEARYIENNYIKSKIIKRINNRTEKYIKRFDEKKHIVNKDELYKFIMINIYKLDVIPKKIKTKGEKIFKTDWGEDIYRRYSFLGAELNKNEYFSEINKKIVNYIKINELKNKKPTDSDVEKFIEKIFIESNKMNMNEYDLLFRKSFIKIMKSVIDYATPFNYNFYDEDSLKEKISINIKLDLSTLSRQEIKILSSIFEINTSQDVSFIEVCSVENIKEMEIKESIALKEIVSILYNELPNKIKDYNKEEIDKVYNDFIKIKDNEIKELNYLKNKDIYDKIKSNKKNMKIYSVLIFLPIIISIFIMIYKLLS